VFNLTGGGLFYDAVSNIRLNSINWLAELARMNEELERMNDEMDRINNALERMNDEFNRTNDEPRG
jgi:archaellum component FlaC